MRKLTAKFCLIIAVLIASVGVSWSADFQRGDEFEATITYNEMGLYQVHLSNMPGLKWIETMGCIELLILDDVLIEVVTSNGKAVGGFFYVVDSDEPREDWDNCQITGFYRSKPSD